jgi:N-acetylglutamate synthase-like GNAT family acetyltransferase
LIRRATATDAPAVHALRQRAIRESTAGLYDAHAVEAWATGSSEADVRRKIAATTGFVAVRDCEVVGWAALEGSVVDQLYVRPDHGGSGVARALVGIVEEQARASGVAELTAVASLRAAPVFARLGFSEVARRSQPFDGQLFEVADVAKRL